MVEESSNKIITWGVKERKGREEKTFVSPI